MNPEEVTRSGTTTAASRSWLPGLVIVVIIIVGYGFLYSKNTNNDVAYLVGSGLAASLLAWLGYQVFVARWHKMGLSFLVIFVAMVACDLIGYARHGHETERAMQGIRESVSSFVEHVGGTQSPTRPFIPMPRDPLAAGELGELEGCVRRVVNDAAAHWDSYLAKVEATGWTRLFDPNRLADDESLSGSREIIRQMRDLIHKNQLAAKDLINRIRNDIQGLNVSEEVRQRTLFRFDLVMENAQVRFALQFELGKRAVSEAESMINLLYQRRGYWKLEKGRILFMNENDLKDFNSHFSAMREIACEEESIKKEAARQLMQAVEQLREKEPSSATRRASP